MTKGKRPTLFHFCIFDRDCWRYYFQLGSPMRLRVRNFQVTLLTGGWRSRQIWKNDEDNPVALDNKDD